MPSSCPGRPLVAIRAPHGNSWRSGQTPAASPMTGTPSADPLAGITSETLGSGVPSAAPGQAFELARVTFAPEATIPLHTNPGSQARLRALRGADADSDSGWGATMCSPALGRDARTFAPARAWGLQWCCGGGEKLLLPAGDGPSAPQRWNRTCRDRGGDALCRRSTGPRLDRRARATRTP